MGNGKSLLDTIAALDEKKRKLVVLVINCVAWGLTFLGSGVFFVSLIWGKDVTSMLDGFGIEPLAGPLGWRGLLLLVSGIMLVLGTIVIIKFNRFIKYDD